MMTRTRRRATGVRASWGAIWLGALLLGALLLAPLSGCGYPKISRPAFELAKAVSNLCNARAEEQLDLARDKIAAAHKLGEITEAEYRYLGQIVELAERGQWERAERQSRRMLADQTDW